MGVCRFTKAKTHWTKMRKTCFEEVCVGQGSQLFPDLGPHSSRGPRVAIEDALFKPRYSLLHMLITYCCKHIFILRNHFLELLLEICRHIYICFSLWCLFSV